MNKWIKDLWNNNKLLFFILIPIVILVFFNDIIMQLIASGARKEVNKTKSKDDQLKTELKELDEKANMHKKNADNIRDERDNVEVDEDWYKND
jgi:hypothetical protein